MRIGPILDHARSDRLSRAIVTDLTTVIIIHPPNNRTHSRKVEVVL
jgi:hypothetical protein